MTTLLYEEYFGGELKDLKDPKRNRILNRWQYKVLERLKHNPNSKITKDSLQNRLCSDNYCPIVSEDNGSINFNNSYFDDKIISDFIVDLKNIGYIDKNGKLSIDRFLNIKQKISIPKLSGPRGAFLELTKLCNLRCTHCYNETTRSESNNNMSTDKIMTFIDELYDLGATSIALTGGETTLNKDWFEIASHAKSKDLSIRLYTCGVYSSEKIRKETIDKLVSLDPEEIRVTYTGMKNINDKTRLKLNGQGTFDDITDTIKMMVEKDLNLKLNYTFAKENKNDTEEFLRFIYSLKKNSSIPVNIGPLRAFKSIEYNEGLELLDLEKKKLFVLTRPDSKDFYDVNQLVYSLRKELGMNISITFDCLDELDDNILSNRLNKINNTPHTHLHQGCGLGKAGLGVGYDGTVNVCGIMGYNRELAEQVIKIISIDKEKYNKVGITQESLRNNVFVNINDRTLEDIWYNSPLLSYFQTFYKKEQCVPCEKYIVQCKGMCPAMALMDNNDIRSGDRSCIKPLLKSPNLRSLSTH